MERPKLFQGVEIKLKRKLIEPIASILLSVLLYSFVLSLDLPSELAIAFRYETPLTLALAALLLYLAYRLRGWIGTTISLAATLVLFALPLSALWSTGMSGSYIIGGLFPYVDAAFYYGDAQQLLQGPALSAQGFKFSVICCCIKQASNAIEFSQVNG